ncbi:MAG: porin [Methylococcaceae bacterium]|nr:porin [Methylococcaceae bacterium]
MKLSRLTLAVATVLTASFTTSVFALDLYVDSKTKQIFAAPGKGRQKMGSFEQVNEPSQRGVSADSTQHLYNELENEKIEIKKVQTDLELKSNEIKSLEEHVVANREEKAKNDEKWFNKIQMRGYTQLRYNQPLSGDREANSQDPELKSPGDGGIGDNKGFTFRRVRLVFSGDINEYISLYLQPDFAASVPGGTDANNFVQLRDAYADLSFDKKHEYRIRAGQSKVPFGWENLQSSQNRLTLDRADALNSAVPSERDLGLFAYWTPENTQKLWKTLSKKGLKTSGDYGVVGFGVYNGQSINKSETNDDLYYVAHATYPVELDFLGSFMKGQVIEVGADAMSGKFNVTTADITPFGSKTALLKKDIDKSLVDLKGKQGMREERVGVHAVLFPQPFGLQSEWNWGEGATLNTAGKGSIESQSLNGGYVMAMYKIDKVLRSDDSVIPYAKWQTYDGAYKAANNAPRVSVEEIEAGVEWQMMKALEVTVAYSTMNRTNVGNLGQASGDMIRTQLQWNY